MYAFVDRQVISLDHGCRFLVWSLRSWALIAHNDQCPGPALAPAFAKWRVIGALQPFVRLMVAFDHEPLLRLRFCSLQCNRIAEHEAIVLSLFANMAAGERTTVRDTLAQILCDEVLGDALAAIDAISASLAISGMPPAIPGALRR